MDLLNKNSCILLWADAFKFETFLSVIFCEFGCISALFGSVLFIFNSNCSTFTLLFLCSQDWFQKYIVSFTSGYSVLFPLHPVIQFCFLCIRLFNFVSFASGYSILFHLHLVIQFCFVCIRLFNFVSFASGYSVLFRLHPVIQFCFICIRLFNLHPVIQFVSGYSISLMLPSLTSSWNFLLLFQNILFYFYFGALFRYFWSLPF